MTIYCPDDTHALINQGNVKISNFALRYRYFLDTRQVEEKVAFGLQARQPDQSLNLENSQIEPLRNRQTDQLRHIASNGHFYCATSRMDWRMVIGLGSSHVQETNMTLDHVHGIPYLPGSAFKGIVRSWVIQECFNDDEALATRDIEDADPTDLKQEKCNFFAVFGSQKSAGTVQFLDALPNSGVHFDIDIMNPHFSEYYTRSEFPTDYLKLIQIYFLALKNTHFRFLIVAKTAGSLQLAIDWFTQAIVNRGFGAKSAVGYGYFRELNDITEKLKYEFAEKLGLDEAYSIYHDYPDQRESVYINIESLTPYAPRLAVIVSEGICDVNTIEGIDEIPENLIEMEADMVVPSEFGKWVWEKTKEKLFEEILPPFPNLIYRSRFNRPYRNLTPDQRTLLQEKLLQKAIDFRRVLNTNLQEDERELLEERLMQIAYDLGNGAIFASLSADDRESLAEKLLDIAANLAIQEETPDLINVEGGGTITCGGIEEGNLILREYSNQ